MNGYEDALKEILSKNGWAFLRHGKGSHEIWAKSGHSPQTIPKGCRSRHLANKILKQCGINHHFS